MSKITDNLKDMPMISNGDYNNNITINLNTVVKAGTYRIGANAVNIPGGGYGQLLVLRNPAQDTITQIYSDYTNSAMYTRSGNPTDVGGSGVWRDWKKILMTDTSDVLTISNLLATKFTNTGPTLSIGGGNIRQWAGDTVLTTGFTVDVPIGYQGSSLLICNHWHWGNGGYGAGRMSNVSVGPNATLIDNNIQNFATSMGGSWSFARLDNNTVRVTKTPGSYNAVCVWHITSIGN